MYKNLKRQRVITSVQQVEELLKCIKKYRLKVIRLGDGYCPSLTAYIATHKDYTGLKDNFVIHSKDTKLEITTYYGFEKGKNCTYIFSLNEEAISDASGLKCFAEFQKYFKIPKAKDAYKSELIDQFLDTDTEKYSCSASPILGFNPKYNEQELKDCYEYDLNSAYFSTLLKKVPDLYNPDYSRKLKVDYVGFILYDKLPMVIKPGNYCDIQFPLIDTPEGLLKYCRKYYSIKSTTKDKIIKQSAKDHLNLPIGYCQRYNPFLRAYVVNSCNNFIKSVIDDNTLFWNTDAIFSRTRRTDLKIGSDIGQFKEIKCDRLRYRNNTYQINDDKPVYRGIPKAWFEAFEKKYGRPFDLLKDPIPDKCNKWKWNWDTLTLTENNYETL